MDGRTFIKYLVNFQSRYLGASQASSENLPRYLGTYLTLPHLDDSSSEEKFVPGLWLNTDRKGESLLMEKKFEAL